MSGRVFFDTNILVYPFALSDPRNERARALIEEIGGRGDAVVSTQVLMEFYTVLTRRLLPRMDAGLALATVTHLAQWEVVAADGTLVLSALDRSGRQQLSVRDALILEAALAADCPLLYSEDFQHGRDYGGVKVVNPFLAG
jgi:predicted nucleic acid-binding protein